MQQEHRKPNPDPHVHAVFLDGVYRDKQEDDGDALAFRALAHLTTRDVAAVLERTRDRMTKYIRRRGLLDDGDTAEEADASERAGLPRLAASAVSGKTPPAGPSAPASIRTAPAYLAPP